MNHLSSRRLFHRFHRLPVISRILLGALLLAASHAWAATTPPLDPSGGRVEDRQQLRVLLGGMEKSISSGDIEASLKLMQPTAVITWQDGQVSHGAAAIRAYHRSMFEGPTAKIKKFSTKVVLGAPADFYGDTAIAYGTEVDNFELANGATVDLNADWSTTVVKTDGQWKVAALHFSTDLTDNAILNAAKKMIWSVGGAGLLAGILITLLALAVKRR